MGMVPPSQPMNNGMNPMMGQQPMNPSMQPMNNGMAPMMGQPMNPGMPNQGNMAAPQPAPMQPMTPPVPEMANASLPLGEPVPDPEPAPVEENAPAEGTSTQAGETPVDASKIAAPNPPTAPVNNGVGTVVPPVGGAPAAPMNAVPGSQPVGVAPVQPMPVPPMQPPVYGQPAGQVPMNGYPNPAMGNQPQSNDKKFIIAAIVVALVAVIIIIAVIFVFNKDKKEDSKTSTSNEYEESGKNSNTNTNSNTNSNDDEIVDNNTMTYGGLEFPKVKGYSYAIEDDVLVISSNDKLFRLTLLSGDYSKWTENASGVQKELQDQGLSATYPLQGLYKDKYMLTSTLSDGTSSAMYAITQSPAAGYCFQFLAINAMGTADSTLYTEAAEILEDVKVVGSTSTFSGDKKDFLDF